MERLDRFMETYNYDLGYFNNEANRVVPVGENPFAPIVLPMSPVWIPKEVVERVGLLRSGCQDAWQAQSARKYRHRNRHRESALGAAIWFRVNGDSDTDSDADGLEGR
jgi:hypothetical protein